MSMLSTAAFALAGHSGLQMLAFVLSNLPS